jgi:hypothetical protein
LKRRRPLSSRSARTFRRCRAARSAPLIPRSHTWQAPIRRRRRTHPKHRRSR